jgi:hypothetical protein
MDEAAYQFGQYILAAYPTSSSDPSVASRAVVCTVYARYSITEMSTHT